MIGTRWVAGLAGLLLAQSSVFAESHAIDLRDPADNLKAMVRITGSLENDPVYWRGRGRIYLVLPGQIAQPLFDAEAVSWTQFRLGPNGTYIKNSQFVQLHYRNGRVVTSMKNPVTGKTISVPILQSRGGLKDVEYSIYGIRMPGVSRSVSQKRPRAPKVYEWDIAGDNAVLVQEAFSTYQAPWMPTLATENSFRFYQTSLAELNDAAKPSVPATRFEVSETELMPWLEMPEGQSGHMVWRFIARKFQSQEDLPASLVKDLAQHTPEFYEELVRIQ